MPRVKRERLPGALIHHLLLRMQQRQVRAAELTEFSRWLDLDPIVPEGKWYKRFENFIVCGEGELVKTFLMPGQWFDGAEVE